MSETGLVHFDHALHASHAWVHDLMEEMNWGDPHCSYQALRSVLHALRDALPIDDVIALGGEMPLFVRGSYYEGWHPAQHKKYRKTKKKEFLAQVARSRRPTSGSTTSWSDWDGRTTSVPTTPCGRSCMPCATG